jgi:tripeptidyl-peptidase-1
VHEWLLTNGIEKFDYSPAKDWVNVYINVETAERLLDTEYHIFEHEDGTQVSRAPEWSLPKHLHEHIDTIQPTNVFMNTKALASQWKQFDKPWTPPDYKPPTDAAIAKACSINGTTPDCFATLYQFKGYHQKVPGINQIGFNNFLGEIPIQPDAVKFLKQYAPQNVPGAYTAKRIDIAGGPDQTGPLNATQAASGISKEANLDFQTILGITYPMPVTSYSTGGAPPQIGDAAAGDDPGNEPYLTWVNYALGQKFPPQVISTSYADDEQTVPLDYAKRVCNSFAQLGARGVTLLFGSGDGGAGGKCPLNVCCVEKLTVGLPSHRWK